MSALTTAGVTLFFVIAGATIGMSLRLRLPEHHVKDDSKDILKTATGMIATLVALVIGLLVSSSKNAFDSANAGLAQVGAKAIMLDRLLGKFGPETQSTRQLLKQVMVAHHGRIWPEGGGSHTQNSAIQGALELEDVQDSIRRLEPKTPWQREEQTQALQLGSELLQSRWLLIEQSQNVIPVAFLVILIFWLTVLFTGFGLLAPWNLTSALSLLVCAVSMSGAVFLILEMNRPLQGIIKVSDAPFQKMLDVLGK